MALLLLVVMRPGPIWSFVSTQNASFKIARSLQQNETASSEALEMKVRRCELELFALFLSRDFSVVADYSKAKRNF